MRSRTSLTLAGALLVTLAPDAAEATQAGPAATVAVAVAGDTVTIRSNGDVVGVLSLDEDGRATVDGVVIDIVDGVVVVAGGGSDDAGSAPPDPGELSVSDDTIIVDQHGGVLTVDDPSDDPNASTQGAQDLDTAPGRM